MNDKPDRPGPRLDEIVERIYAAALQPERWADVMALMKRRFASSAEAFYFLDFEPHRVRPVHLAGISDNWYRKFDGLYFTRDNPWVVHTKALHRPGVIRTNERLAEYARDAQVLYRSTYYNEWMRPQKFRYTIGNTMHSERGTIANLTLLREPDMRSFSAAEVRAFDRLSVHFTRALNVAMRLESAAQARDRNASLFDELVHGVVTLDSEARLLYANSSAHDLLARGRGLSVRDGFLVADDCADQSKLLALVRDALIEDADGRHAVTVSIGVGAGPKARVGDAAHAAQLTVNAIRVASGPARYLASRPAVLLTIVDTAVAQVAPARLLHERYQFTPAEARLARALAEGASLKQAAERIGITYGTARGYLKLLFQKTDTHSQAQLVGQLLREFAGRI